MVGISSSSSNTAVFPSDLSPEDGPLTPNTYYLGNNNKKMLTVWWAWLKRPVSLQWSTEHLVQLHDFYRESHYPGKDRNGHLRQLFWRTERWGTIPPQWASGFRHAQCRQQLSLSGMDTNQSTRLGWKTQSLFLFLAKLDQNLFDLSPSPLWNSQWINTTFMIWAKSTGEQLPHKSGFQIQGSQFSSKFNVAPLPWTWPPGSQNEVDILVLASTRPCFSSFSLWVKMSPNDFSRSFWTQIKHAAYGTGRIFWTVPQTHGRVVILQKTVFWVCLD